MNAQKQNSTATAHKVSALMKALLDHYKGRENTLYRLLRKKNVSVKEIAEELGVTGRAVRFYYEK